MAAHRAVPTLLAPPEGDPQDDYPSEDHPGTSRSTTSEPLDVQRPQATPQSILASSLAMDFHLVSSKGNPSHTLSTSGAREQILETMKADLSADPNIMRGVSWTPVLSRAAAQLRAGPQGDPTAAACAYGRSARVTGYHTFLSHSWHASPTLKALALLQKRNGWAADVVGVCAVIVTASLDLAGLLPVWKSSVDASYLELWSPGGPSRVDLRGWATLSFFVARSVTLLTWHHVDFMRRKERCFVDKLCIHQTDAELKQRAVSFIGHYLMETKEMLVMLDTTYLQRVWCVFELATFLGLKMRSIRPKKGHVVIEKGRLVICPNALYGACAFIPGTVSLIWMGLVGSIAVGLMPWALNFLQQRISGQLALTVVVAPFMSQACAVCMVLLRMFQRSHRKIMEMLDSFSLAHAQCLVESDRDFVAARVCDLYGSVEMFEAFAKQQVKASLQALLGPMCEISFSTCFRAVVLPSLAWSVDLFLMQEEASWSYRLHYLSGVVVLMITLMPFFIKVLEVTTELSLRFFNNKRDFGFASMFIVGILLSAFICGLLGNGRWVVGQDSLTKVTVSSLLALACATIWNRIPVLHHFRCLAGGL